MNIVRRFLSIKYPAYAFDVDDEYKILEGKRYAMDDSIEVVEVTGPEPKQGKPVFGLEYKPRVSSDLTDITPFHISETLIQAYYLRKKFQYPILHCLSDLQ